MKRSELIFNIVSIPVDIISLTLAGLVSFYIRLRLESYVPIIFKLDLREYLLIIAQVVPVLLLVFALFGLYNLKGTRKFSVELSKIVSAISTSLLFVIVMFFFDQKIFPSRLIILVAWVLSIIFVIAGRYMLRAIQTYFLNRGLGLHRLVIIKGLEDSGLIEKIRTNKGLSYHVVAELHESDDLIDKLEDLYVNEKIEEILQANPYSSETTNLQLVQFSRSKGLDFHLAPNLFNVHRNVVETVNIEGIPVISFKNTPLVGWGKVVKRIFDIIVSLICILLTSPLFIIIPILIKLNSKGKVLYSAPRGGRGKDFMFYKFRTMYTHLSVGAEYGGEEAEKIRQELWKVNARGGENGPFLKIKDDPRVTSVGRFLRKTKLDEIPQFFNVLFGDMSMVGPRAHVIDEVEKYRSQYRRLFTIKPGIFGLSQIAQINWPDLPFEEEIRLNTFYIENWSVWLDVKILAKSAYYIFFGKKSNENY